MTKQRAVPLYAYVGGFLIVALLGIGPFFLADNPVAQVLFNVMVAGLTLLVSVQTTRHYSEHVLQENLTRYGLQAWRTLNALQVKVAQHLGAESVSDTTLEAWIMDIDGAKWAWRDLLRELFELQNRLEVETEEVAQRYKQDIAASTDPRERAELEMKRTAEIARLQSQAPLAFKLAEEVDCPQCQAKLTARLGREPGASDWPVCPRCGTHFPVFRQPDGSVETSRRSPVATITDPCPACGEDIGIPMYEDRELSFLVVCHHCRTHLQFRGDLTSHSFENLGVDNAHFECPGCGVDQPCWIAPGRRVSFRTKCNSCRKWVHLHGTRDSFKVSAT